MKRQNLVMLTGKLADYAEQTDPVGGWPAYVIIATLVTDHPAYGGHHRVLFADRLTLELRTFREVSQAAPPEVTVDGGCARSAGKPWWSPIGSCTTSAMRPARRRRASRIGRWRWPANAASGAATTNWR